SLVAGTQFRGQFESRIKGLIEEIRVLGNVILMIDEVHNIVGAGDAEGSMSAANILKPALSRGEIQVIGATTLNEYRKHIEKDSALERRFQPVMVEESNIDDTVDILKGIKKYYENFHGVKIPNDVLRTATLMSERYINDRFLPDKAIDLMDEAAAFLALSSPVISEYKKCVDEIKSLKIKREAIEGEEAKDEKAAEEKYQTLADIKSKEMKAEIRLGELEAEKEKVVLKVQHLAHVIEIWTGIPASNISESEFEKLDNLDSRIKKYIIGQDKAIDSVVKAIKRNRAGVSPRKKPVSFIFAGPTGVGKTELVKRLASELFNSPETLIRLDMSEFMEKHSVSRIIGAPPGYVGYDEAGQLTEKIRRKPYSVILFDEIEKAHPDVLNILLQILDDGRISDAHGKQVNFENAVIVMTTNAGSNYNTNVPGFNTNEDVIGAAKTEKALLEFLRPEFLNRIDEVITFRALNEEDFGYIANIMLDELKEALSEKSIEFVYTDNASRLIAAKSFSRKYGARNMRRYVQTNVEDEVANIVIENYAKGISKISLDTRTNDAGEEILNIVSE
ncbi:MAG: ATP-dependent Clp protease ATP-binding subunit, partial [Ruminococcaceae bacterium]|nr:ATP-dependent Clp protease ATP-binding subunit [Oscillospiraceae bacterium]